MKEDVFKRNHDILKKAILEVSKNCEGDGVVLMTSVANAMQHFIHGFAVGTNMPVRAAEEFFFEIVKQPKTEGN